MAWWRRTGAEAELDETAGNPLLDAEVATSGEPANADAPRPQSAGASLEEALASLASVLRTLGQLRFPIGDEERQFHEESESWARHVMTGCAPPQGAPSSERNWRGVREHVRRRRVAERDYLDSRIAGFTDVLAEVVSQLQGLTGHSEQTAASIHRTMGELGRAADDASLEQLRAHVRRTVRGVRDQVENQRSQFSDKVRNLGERLAATHSDLGQAREEAKLDPLTQLYTTAALEGELDRGGQIAELSGIHLSLVCVRIDAFSQLTSAHGFEAGNDVLRAVADCVSLCFFRKSDFVARHGDEGFAVLLWDTELSTAERGAERLLKKLRRLRVPHEPKPLALTASVGVCSRHEGENSYQFIDRAAGAARRAERGGGDRRESVRP